MTYTIIARCPRTGQFGLATASYSVAIGLYCDGAIRSNTGVTVTQGFPYPRNNRLAINLLAQGFTAQHALKQLAGSDPHFDYRQIGIVDRNANVVAHSGTKIGGWCGHRIGEGYVALGSTLTGQKVVDAIASRFAADAKADLVDRLLSALEAGRDAGGIKGANGRLPERSVALVIYSKHDFNDIDIRVDLHDKAVDELRRIYVDYKPSIAYYDERARNPRNAIPAMEFADILKNQQAKETT